MQNNKDIREKFAEWFYDTAPQTTKMIFDWFVENYHPEKNKEYLTLNCCKKCATKKVIDQQGVYFHTCGNVMCDCHVVLCPTPQTKDCRHEYAKDVNGGEGEHCFICGKSRFLKFHTKEECKLPHCRCTFGDKSGCANHHYSQCVPPHNSDKKLWENLTEWEKNFCKEYEGIDGDDGIKCAKYLIPLIRDLLLPHPSQDSQSVTNINQLRGEWKEEFLQKLIFNEFQTYEEDTNPTHWKLDCKKLEIYISSLLSSQLQELRTKIEGMKESIETEDYEKDTHNFWWNQALEAVLSIINEPKEK